MYKFIDGGVCAPKGFKANAVTAGIKYTNGRKDLSLIYADRPCSSAAVYTTNLVKSATISVTQKHLEDGIAQAIICNSGNANTCNANGVEVAEAMCNLAGNALGIDPNNIVVASTGVIGLVMPIKPVEDHIDELVKGLKADADHSALAWEGIHTTDTVKKEIAIEFTVGGKTCRVGGICKGSGMIHPNMATMLGFITTDVAITPKMIKKALTDVVDESFNMLSIDGDTSTNDTVCVLASGTAQNPLIDSEGPLYDEFMEGFMACCKKLARAMAKDGEGATKLLVCEVLNAKTKKDAKIAAKSVICSSLFKAAMFGADANWGRALCAIGYSTANVDITKIDAEFESRKGIIPVCKNGASIPFSEEKAKEILLEDEITIRINLNDGDGYSEAFGCDLTYDYVKINGDYRS